MITSALTVDAVWKKVIKVASISVPITVNLPDDWKEQILERIKQDDDWVCVVRCKDCKWFGESECLMCFDGHDWAYEEGFCQNGVLKDGEQDG